MPLSCQNCGVVLSAGRRYFCGDDCRQEYHRRGMHPRPGQARPAARCEGCGAALSGKQTKWCNEVCRQRARRDRRRAAQWRPTPAQVKEWERNFISQKLYRRPGLTGLWGDFPGRVRDGRLVVRFRCVQVVPHLGTYLPEYHLRNPEFMQIYKDLLETVMNREVFGYVVEVTIE